VNILIVDGNEKVSSEKYTELGMLTQYEVYQEVLEKISAYELNISIVHPTWGDDFLPPGTNLDDFDGIAWTGSILNIYDLRPDVQRQIDLAKILLQKKNKIFGSCWGLQVLATAAGGHVRKNPKGLEAVIAKKITLNKQGINHPMYNDKPYTFDSFCWHYDIVENLPANSIVLSSNDNSDYQSVTFSRNNSEVWGVQYHPEFNSKWISGLISQRKSILLEENIFSSEHDCNIMYNYLSDLEKYDSLRKDLEISETLIDDKIRYRELINWLTYLKGNFSSI